MKEPKRLIQEGSPSAKALLAALEEDVPPDVVGGQAQVLRALGIDPGDSGPTSAPPPSHTRRRWPSVALAAALGLAAVSMATFGASRGEVAPQPAEAIGSADEAISGGAAPELAQASEVGTNVPVALVSVDVHALAPAAPEATVGRSMTRSRRADVRRGTRGPAPSSSPERTATPPARDAADELQMLERAQAEAAHGRPEVALRLVARHRREFPQGRFVVEMKVAEIEALARAGRADEAAARGARFLEDHPGSPYTRRVEAIVRTQDKREQAR